MAAKYHHDYEGFRAHVLKAPFMAAEMLKRAERVKAYAEAHAPYDPRDADGQHYRDAFSAEVVEDEERVRGRVKNTDMPMARFVEFGFEAGVDKNGREYPAFPRHRTLGNALEAAKD